MISISVLGIAPLWRRGTSGENGAYTTERWSWDFVIDGQSLRSIGKNYDVAGILGWADADVERQSVAKLLGEAEPDLPPNRVALMVCPECGDLGCGALTVAIDCESGSITWSDFRWEVDWVDPASPEAPIERFEIGPFRFASSQYADVLREAQTRPRR